jgi:hypothetical protein
MAPGRQRKISGFTKRVSKMSEPGEAAKSLLWTDNERAGLPNPEATYVETLNAAIR